MFVVFGVMVVATCGMFKTSQKLTASTKLDSADGDASCSCKYSKYASTSAASNGNGEMLKENLGIPPYQALARVQTKTLHALSDQANYGFPFFFGQCCARCNNCGSHEDMLN